MSSVPQFNLKEVNNAMIKLLWNPDIDFDEIYCPPDFCTGATILNANEVKESLRNGTGKSIVLRSSISYDDSENCLYVTEVPYGVYTGTIIGQIKEAMENGEFTEIRKIDDLSNRKANIKILLEKNANYTKTIKKLYKLTSLQDNFTIHLVMLNNGKYPKIFSWREALQAHLNHEIEVRTKIHKYDLEAIEARINIIDGLLLAIANIDEVVSIIRSSQNKDEAKLKLEDRFKFNKLQSDAILKISLARLVNLEVKSYEDEKEKLMIESSHIKDVLSNKELLYKEIEKGMREISDKYGDERRTKCINLDFTDEEEPEPIEEKELLIHYTNYNNLYTQESTTLLTSRRGLKGSKVKLANDEAIIETLNITNLGSILLFTTAGKVYNLYTCDLPVNGKVNVNRLFDFEENEKINAVIPYNKDEATYFCFVTEKGFLKKTAISEYNFRRNSGIRAINLSEGDNVVSVMPIKDEKICILTDSGRAIFIDSTLVNAIGRASRGIKGIKLDDNKVISAKKIDKTDDKVLTISKNGLIKKTPISEFSISGTNTKGKKLSEVRANDMIVNFLTFSSDCDIIIIVNNKLLKINTKDVPELSRTATGNKAIGLDDDNYVVNVIKSIS